MLLPTLSSGSGSPVRSSSAESTNGISPSFCTPCVLGKRLCGLPFSPSLENCGGDPGGGGTPSCTKVGPCIPFINKQVCVGLGGVQLVNCG